MVKKITLFCLVSCLFAIVTNPVDFYNSYSSVLNPIISTLIIALLVGLIILLGYRISDLDSEIEDLESDLLDLNNEVYELQELLTQERNRESEIHVIVVWEE